MSTIRFHQTTTSTPEQFVAGLTDFGPGRSKLFGNSADEYLKVHHPGALEADVTEGSNGIWERLHYDWSDPTRVVMTTTDSNLWKNGSGHTYTFTRRSDGTTDVNAVVVCATARTSRDTSSDSCSAPSAAASCSGRLKTASRPSKRGTARPRNTHHERASRRDRRNMPTETADGHGRSEISGIEQYQGPSDPGSP